MANKWVALGGGGYDMSAVARGWTLDYGIMSGQEWPDKVPESYRHQYGLERLRDRAAPAQEPRVSKAARALAEESVREIKARLFPLHDLR